MFNKKWFWVVTVLAMIGILWFGNFALADGQSGGFTMPGAQEADTNKLVSVGAMLRVIDTAVFIWGTRILCGVSIIGAGWAMKQQRMGTAGICLSAAVVCAFVPWIVRNLFEIGGSEGVFSTKKASIQSPPAIVAKIERENLPYA